MNKLEIIKELKQIRDNHNITRLEVAKQMVFGDAEMVLKYTRDLDDLECGEENKYIKVGDYQVGLMRVLQVKKIAPSEHERNMFSVRPTAKVIKMNYQDHLPSRG